MINSKDVSVVIQGLNVKKHTKKCVDSIRKFLPNAKIIFSTYEDEVVDNLDVDIVVRSKDPGGTVLSGKWYNNINRILVTTKAGLEKVDTKYCIKIRSDMLFVNSNILNNIVEKFPRRDEKYKTFNERVVFYELWSRQSEYVDGSNKILCPFHLSDWLCFGLTEDVKSYYMTCPLTQEPDFSYYFKNPENFVAGPYKQYASWQFPPEQWICLNYFNKFYDVQVENSLVYSMDDVELSKILLANNVVIAGYSELGVTIQKKPYDKVSRLSHYIVLTNSKWLDGVCTYGKFIKEYQRYCDSEVKLLKIDKFVSECKIENYINHLSKHVVRVIKPIKLILFWFSSILSVLYYLFKILTGILKHYCK